MGLADGKSFRVTQPEGAIVDSADQRDKIPLEPHGDGLPEGAFVITGSSPETQETPAAVKCRSSGRQIAQSKPGWNQILI